MTTAAVARGPRESVACAVTVLSLLAAACTGDIIGDTPTDATMPPGTDSGQGATAGSAGQATGVSAPMGVTVMHRLNQVELRNTVTELFGEAASHALLATPDPRVQGFDTNADALTISESGVDSLMRVAGNIAAGLDLEATLPCAAVPERQCAADRFAALALRILRRPPSPSETTSYLTLWDEVSSRTDADTATRAVIQRLLMTPDFLYHVEWGDDAGQLDAYELAARLAYFAWESTPDAELLETAASGGLDSAAGLGQALERLLAGPRGQAALLRFFEQWVELDKLEAVVKDADLYPGFEALKQPMASEFRAFLSSLLQSDGTVRDLLTSTTTYVDTSLASLYGVGTPAPGSGRVTLPNDRAGFLMQGAFLSAHAKANKTAPIQRGRFIREQLLCAPVPPPPPGANTVEPNAAVPTTTREYYAQLTAPVACNSCHSQLNPVGFAFEGFDAIGRVRTEENGHPVDTTGELTAGDQAGSVSDALELVARLAESQDVRACLAAQLFRSRYRRSEVDGDASIIQSVAQGVGQSGDKLLGLARLLAAQPAMRRRHFRVPAATETMP